MCVCVHLSVCVLSNLSGYEEKNRRGRNKWNLFASSAFICWESTYSKFWWYYKPLKMGDYCGIADRSLAVALYLCCMTAIKLKDRRGFKTLAYWSKDWTPRVHFYFNNSLPGRCLEKKWQPEVEALDNIGIHWKQNLTGENFADLWCVASAGQLSFKLHRTASVIRPEGATQ